MAPERRTRNYEKSTLAWQSLLLEALRLSIADEREACAWVAERHSCPQPPQHAACAGVIAAAIRAR